jgi:hypothetical protein
MKLLDKHVFHRCGRAVSRLVETGLAPRPEMPTSEAEVHEWWLVSAPLGAKLRERGAPVLEFCELSMWGRAETGVPVEQDADLAAALSDLRAAARPLRRDPRSRRR